MNLRFDHKVVLVTGGAQGIGRAIAAAFVAAGARVHLADMDGERLPEIATELDCAFHVLDLSNRAQSAALIARIHAQEGRLDILALAAGGVRGLADLALENITEENWDLLFAANLRSALWVAQAAAPLMRAQGQGRIVTISSSAGLRPSLTGLHAYTAAKHALVGLTRQLSVSLAAEGVTVNSVAPGFVLSNPSTHAQWEAYGPDGQQALVNAIHTRRTGSADDIAASVLFLSSDQAGWITGQILSVDGGRS